MKLNKENVNTNDCDDSNFANGIEFNYRLRLYSPSVSYRLTTGELSKRDRYEKPKKISSSYMDCVHYWLPDANYLHRRLEMTDRILAIPAIIQGITICNKNINQAFAQKEVDHFRVKEAAEQKRKLMKELTCLGYRVASPKDFKEGSRIFSREDGWSRVLSHRYMAGVWETTQGNSVVFSQDAYGYYIKGN